MQAGRDQGPQHKASLASVTPSGSMTSGKEIWSKPVSGTIVSGMGLLSWKYKFVGYLQKSEEKCSAKKFENYK